MKNFGFVFAALLLTFAAHATEVVVKPIAPGQQTFIKLNGGTIYPLQIGYTTDGLGNPVPIGSSSVVVGSVIQGPAAANHSSPWWMHITDGTNDAAVDPTFGLDVDVKASALPTGAATSALQTTGNSSLATLATNLAPKGAATTANSNPVTIATDQVVPVSATALPLPSGAATSTLQNTTITTLGSPMQNTGGSVSLGTTVGKVIKMTAGNLTSTTVTAGQTVATYTVTAGKTFYLEEADCAVSLNSGAATQEQFGTCQLLINGSTVWQQFYKGPGSGSFLTPIMYSEPIPVAAGQVITWQATPNATSSFLWYANIGGYEK